VPSRAPQAAPSPNGARVATEIANGLARAYKNLHLYGENNPVPRESIDRLFAVLNSFLRDNETLTYTLTETDLLFHGKSVYGNSDRRENFVFKLFRDGVRAVSFHSGIAVEEVTWLLEALSRTNVDREDVDTDIVTQIWERELAHITYIAVDDYFDPETTEEESSQGNKRREPTFAKSAIFDEAEVGSYGLASIPDPSLTDAERALAVNLALTEDELGEVGHQILAEEKDDPRVKVSQIFLNVVASHVSPEMRVDAARVLQVLCSGLLEAGKPADAAALLSESKKVLGDRRDLPVEARVALNSFVESCGLEKELELLEPRIEDAAVQALAGYGQYLSQLNPNSVGPLCGMLGRLKTKKAREMVCRVLSVLGKQNLPELVSFLSDPRWYLVRNIVCVLRMMAEKQSTAFLEPLLTHEDIRVRTELANCLAEIGDDQAMALLARLLHDQERIVRLLAAKRLGQTGGKCAVSLLTQHICEDAFLNRDTAEKSEILDSLGRTGSDEAFPALEKLVRRKGLFNWAENNEMKQCAIAALGRLGTKRALDLLEHTARHSRGGLRKASLNALRLWSSKPSQGGSHE
jgi:hypothetical protein